MPIVNTANSATRLGGLVETVRAADRALEAERSAFSGHCAMCGTPFQGRQEKRFCCDACRTRFSRERKAREVQETIDRLARLAGVEP